MPIIIPYLLLRSGKLKTHLNPLSSFWGPAHQEAIYGTSAWRVYGEGPLFEKEAAKAQGKGAKAAGGTLNADEGRTPLDIRFTAKDKTVYAICLAWPEKDVLVRDLGQKGMLGGEIAAVSMLGSKEKVQWRQTGEGLSLTVPRDKPCRYAFVYKVDLK
jgi:alpha-L-fucosidase